MLRDLQADTPEEARNFSLSLYKMLPRVKLTDLLMEVAEWTGFEESFVHASSNQAPKGEEKSIIMATLMAMGTNIGLTKMAEATPDISYRQMANVMQWRLHEDAMNRAQATLVNLQHRLSLIWILGRWDNIIFRWYACSCWCIIITCRCQIHITELEKEQPFIDLQVINSLLTTQRLFNTNARDAIHVFDGLLHHEIGS